MSLFFLNGYATIYGNLATIYEFRKGLAASLTAPPAIYSGKQACNLLYARIYLDGESLSGKPQKDTEYCPQPSKGKAGAENYFIHLD